MHHCPIQSRNIVDHVWRGRRWREMTKRMQKRDANAGAQNSEERKLNSPRELHAAELPLRKINSIIWSIFTGRYY
jgi:hypothetical protein